MAGKEQHQLTFSTVAELAGPLIWKPASPPYAVAEGGRANGLTTSVAGPSYAVYSFAPTDMKGVVHKPLKQAKNHA